VEEPPVVADPEPKEEPYLVIPILATPKDELQANPVLVMERFEDVAAWWYEKTGKTFRTGPIAVFTSALTRDELESRYVHGNDIWKHLQREAHDLGVIDNTDDHRAHYMIVPMIAAGGGMVGSENYGAGHILPGKAMIGGKEACILLGLDPADHGYVNDLPMAWWFDEVREATGAVAHELGHMFGNGVDQPLPHKDNTIMFSYWDYPNIGFDVEQIETLDGSPFLT